MVDFFHFTKDLVASPRIKNFLKIVNLTKGVDRFFSFIKDLVVFLRKISTKLILISSKIKDQAKKLTRF